MKLLIKIFFQTTCIILLASSGIFLYTTYCWKNQSIQNINSYESSIFRTNILQFENKTSLSDNQKQNADNEMRPQIVTYAFRQVFHDSAVLYLDGKMTYNGTVYEFDVKKLRELCAWPYDQSDKWKDTFVILLWQCKYGISDCYL